MLREQTSPRSFKGGSWDLRRNDRRKAQEMIAFPDRRSQDRRLTDKEDVSSDLESLQWVTSSKLDD